MENGRVTSNSSFGKHRELLRRLAGRRVDRRVRGRLDESDLVQETLLQAYLRREQVRGRTEPERVGWLRAILANKIAAAHRHFRRRRRDVRREAPPGPPSAPSSGGILACLEHPGPAPGEELEREEGLASLAEVLASLPGDQRRAVEMHHLQGLPFAEVAARMGRSKASVAGLVFRGVLALRERLLATESGEWGR
jgi:RNA polymerase sigma-70 factor, ECF subfamily